MRIADLGDGGERITNMKLREKLPYRKLVLLLGVSALAVLVWWLASGPVLFHSRLLATPEDRLCADYTNGEAGIPILNPFRSRAPERATDAFLRAFFSKKCLPAWNERMCEFVAQYPFHVQSWRPVDRYDSGMYVMVIYGLYSQEQAREGRNGCWLFSVQAKRTGAKWEISHFGMGAVRAANVIE